MTTQISGDHVVGPTDTETNTTDSVAYYLGPAATGGPDPTFTIEGSVLVTNNTPYNVLGVVNSIYGFYENSYFLVTSTGRFVVEDNAPGAGATGFSAISFSARVENDGYFSVIGGSGPGGAAQGIVASSFDGTNPNFPYDIKNSGTLEVSAGDFAAGIRVESGASILNSGHLTVSSGIAYGVELDNESNFGVYSTVTNSGQLTAISTGTQPSAGIFIEGGGGWPPSTATLIVNSGVVTADRAIWEAPLRLSVHIENTGTIHGDILLAGYLLPGDSVSAVPSEIDNSGLISGTIYFGDDAVVYSGAQGSQIGGIHLGAGQATVTLGNDGETVQGGSGVARITGGSGNDTFVLGMGSETIVGGGGDDTVLFSADYAAYQFGTANGVLIAVGPNGIDSLTGITTLKFADQTISVSSLSSSHQVIAGTSGNDTLTGGGGNDTLIGLAGDDTLKAAGGDDLLGGGAGNDTLNGGQGADTVTYADAGAGVTVDLQSAKPQNTGGAGIDTLISIENVTGSAYGDVLTAGAGGSVLKGMGGDDLLVAGPGNDTLDGGAGHDTASYALAKSGVSVSLAASGPQNTGGGGKDTLVSIENLIGSKFNDTVTPGAGTESIDGGAGTDTVAYAGGAGGYKIQHLGTEVTITGGGQADTLSNVEVARFADEQIVLSTSGGALTARSSGDTLVGSFGADKLTGGSGDDIFMGNGGGDTLNGGAGINTAVFPYQFEFYTITTNNTVTKVTDHGVTSALQKIQILQFPDRQMVLGATGESLTARDGVHNGLGGDTLLGGSGNDHLISGADIDVLNGGGGQDSLTGGAGTNYFVFGSLTDSKVSAPDLVTDWHSGDYIDLSAIDADTKTPGLQEFHVGATAGHTGDLVVHYDAAHNRTVIDLYVNNDNKADAEIWLTGNHPLSAGDFAL